MCASRHRELSLQPGVASDSSRDAGKSVPQADFSRHRKSTVAMSRRSSLAHAQCQRRSGRAAARYNSAFSNVVDLNGAAGAGHGDNLLTGVANELALDVAYGLAEGVQACRSRGTCWACRTSWTSRTHSAACAVRTRRTGWTRWTSYAGRAGYAIPPLSSRRT